MTSARKRLASGLAAGVPLPCIFSASDAHALPAFARKYGLRCSACHEAWPMLNYFGQKFKDNGYQLMNDRDAPIWQNNGYWPVTMRITPFWHRESTDKVAIDQTGGQQQITAHGFDVGGLDILSGGTLDKNISFLFVLSSDETGLFHFESVNARLDNLFGSPWLNVKMGKFELDNIVSEKRGLTLTASGGGFQIYHFVPVGDNNFFGAIGDNQFGLEWMGHSANDRTRISAALLSSSGGNVDLLNSNAYSGFFAGSQAFDVGKLGTQRVGFYAMVGQVPTGFLTSGGAPIAGGGFGNKGFSREGFTGLFYLGKLDFPGRDPTRLGQRLLRHQYASRHTASNRRTIRSVERRICRNPLRVQSAAHLHSALGVDTNVAAGDSRYGLQSWEHRQLRGWVPLHALYELVAPASRFITSTHGSVSAEGRRTAPT